MRPDTEIEIDGKKMSVGDASDVGGPAHPNVPKKKKKTTEPKGDKEKAADGRYEKKPELKGDKEKAADGRYEKKSDGKGGFKFNKMKAAEKKSKKDKKKATGYFDKDGNYHHTGGDKLIYI